MLPDASCVAKRQMRELPGCFGLPEELGHAVADVGRLPTLGRVSVP